MASNVAARGAPWRDRLARGLARSGGVAAGVALIAVAILIVLALVSYRRSDPAINTDAGGPAMNWLGQPGAWAADLIPDLTNLETSP